MKIPTLPKKYRNVPQKYRNKKLVDKVWGFWHAARRQRVKDIYYQQLLKDKKLVDLRKFFQMGEFAEKTFSIVELNGKFFEVEILPEIESEEIEEKLTGEDELLEEKEQVKKELSEEEVKTLLEEQNNIIFGKELSKKKVKRILELASLQKEIEKACPKKKEGVERFGKIIAEGFVNYPELARRRRKRIQLLFDTVTWGIFFGAFFFNIYFVWFLKMNFIQYIIYICSIIFNVSIIALINYLKLKDLPRPQLGTFIITL
jgi:hypothetical protein